MEVGTTTLVHGSNGSLIIRVNKNVAVVDVERVKEVDEDFDSYGLKPCDISTWNLPIRRKLEAHPPAIDDNADTPRSACIDEDADVQKRTLRR